MPQQDISFNLSVSFTAHADMNDQIAHCGHVSNTQVYSHRMYTIPCVRTWTWVNCYTHTDSGVNQNLFVGESEGARCEVDFEAEGFGEGVPSPVNNFIRKSVDFGAVLGIVLWLGGVMVTASD